MHSKEVLELIRENERNSHIQLYSSHDLYQGGSWLNKPVKTVSDLFTYFKDRRDLRILDLGCGVGRNSIAIAQHFRDVGCMVYCVDILELAIEKLMENAARFDVAKNITGIEKPIEEYSIGVDHYDWIIAISALEHIDSADSFIRKLSEIRDGIRKNGIVCLIINSNVTEHIKSTGQAIAANFEVNLQTAELQTLLSTAFEGWHILKSTVHRQHYDIPRGSDISQLNTDVVTFVARK